MTSISTPDLCDLHEAEPDAKLSVVEPMFLHYGGLKAFSGQISTVCCFEDNSKVAEKVKSPGEGKVLVVDGAASMRCSLLGDQLAAAAIKNGWAGILINGCLRDVEIIKPMPLGVMALASIPRKTVKAGQGETDIEVSFAGTRFIPGYYLYADETGILVAAKDLLG